MENQQYSQLRQEIYLEVVHKYLLKYKNKILPMSPKD